MRVGRYVKPQAREIEEASNEQGQKACVTAALKKRKEGVGTCASPGAGHAQRHAEQVPRIECAAQKAGLIECGAEGEGFVECAAEGEGFVECAAEGEGVMECSGCMCACVS